MNKMNKSFMPSALTLLTSLLLIGCGGSDTIDTNSSTATPILNSNIPYLKANHMNYSQHGTTTLLPTPIKDANQRTINWTITAKSEENAIKLTEHLEFMINKLKEGGNPRAWDKLFLMEAYMKFNHYYTTDVERTNRDIVISKKATTDCAYEVISAHSDAVSGDFFANGDTSVDNSKTAETILASPTCDDERASITAYILERQM